MKHILYVTLHASIILCSSVEAKKINMCNIVVSRDFLFLADPNGESFAPQSVESFPERFHFSHTLVLSVMPHELGGQKSPKISSCM